MTKNCRLCAGMGLEPLMDLGPMLIAHRLATTQDEVVSIRNHSNSIFVFSRS